MNKKLAVIAVLVAGLAVAQITQLDLNVSGRIMALTSGLVIGPLSLLQSNSQIQANRITRSIGGEATIDFTYDAGCQTVALGVVGVRSGDTCSVGIPSASAANSAFSCFASDAGEVSVRQCPAGADPASGVYKVRVISSVSN